MPQRSIVPELSKCAEGILSIRRIGRLHEIGLRVWGKGQGRHFYQFEALFEALLVMPFTTYPL